MTEGQSSTTELDAKFSAGAPKGVYTVKLEVYTAAGTSETTDDIALNEVEYTVTVE
ncbi:hypothetical protein GLW05_11775 [Pontibacillus yanchengensis]|uniref:Uncharacterized protein n=1 Tax=Pontibacillus yanchengensis TaxID=462910 RepID=A0A6I5A0I4_9BACI|nr:hypothetical protein [Pontibacillus yanchengensis]MYL34277.1 hypothetical protein [Pontibacillus yanchengensis]